MTAGHPIRRRLLAEELIRLRRADEQQRYIASQRAGRIDPNPHQIDAVIFALQRIPQGGCILADEVGLGKTIEAGLVIAQMRAEGARRILLITPKPLLGQWRQELLTLFGIEVTEIPTQSEGLQGPGVFVVGREQVGSERGAARLSQGEPFDLCVIDEAHEIFAGLYRRYDRRGRLRRESQKARMAARVKQALVGTPVLLLTATPIQNTLTELWGLVQYVEPTGTLLGDLPTFRTMFCAGDDRLLRPGQGEELRRRVATVCQRTLRRQAQAFLKRPFVDRRTQLFEYSMGPAERALYDDVTQYLLEPELCAFAGGQRRLLLIGFHRRMASSLAALAASLDKVVARLERMLRPTKAAGSRGDDQTLDLFAQVEPSRPTDTPPEHDPEVVDLAVDLEQELDEAIVPDDDDNVPTPLEEPPPPIPNTRIRQELERVRDFVARARACPTDSKAEQLVRALRLALARPEGSGKAVIFTESLTTQAYLQAQLAEAGVVTPDEITLFRGDNTGPRATAALQRWQQQVGQPPPGQLRPSRDVAVRLALVHEFATHTRVLISTEAGAKGLNLQFCETIVNYDLPWNPQRIEQRIGRCHRYGQTRGVTVINFLNRDNAAQRLTFEILSRKLDLFGTVLDASDAVLHEPGAMSAETLAGALGMDFEARLHRIYERARSLEEIEREIAALRETIGETRTNFEQTYRRTAGLIEHRLDEAVRSSLADIEDKLPEGLASFDRQVQGVLRRYLEAIGATYRDIATPSGGVRFEIDACPALPEGMREGTAVVVGRADMQEVTEALHLGHPLVRAAVQEARTATKGRFFVAVQPAVEALAEASGRRGRLLVIKVCYDGFEPAEHILPIAVLEGVEEPLSPVLARALVVQSQLDDSPKLSPPLGIESADVEDLIAEALFVDQAEVEPRERERFVEAIDRIERFMEDRVMVWERKRHELEDQLQQARGRRDAAAGSAARTRAEQAVAGIEDELAETVQELQRLRTRDDDDYKTWRSGALQRRYHAPRAERILDVEFVIV